MNYSVTYEGIAVQRGDILAERMDRVMRAWMSQGIPNTGIGIDIETGEIELELSVVAKDLEEALDAANLLVADALKRVGVQVDWASASLRRFEPEPTQAVAAT